MQWYQPISENAAVGFNNAVRYYQTHHA
jgi:hypothetical protein